MDTTNNDTNSLIQRLKEDLASFPEGMNSLETELESSAKHLPAYLKIIKTHIEQLANVLSLDSHNRRTLDSAGLADPVIQLLKLFRNLEIEDLQVLEELAKLARNWQPKAMATQTAEEREFS